MIKHIKCDIFESGADVICHQVNCQGVMGSGIAKQVRNKYPEIYKAYIKLCDTCKTKKSLLLGTAHLVIKDDGKYIANLFAQENYGYNKKCYTDYNALKECLINIKNFSSGKVVAIPYLMGCYRGGGDWNIVYKMIEDIYSDIDCDVLICEYNGG